MTFTLELVKIAEISSNQLIAVGNAYQHERMYKFSNFLPTSNDQYILSHANDISKIWHERFGHMNYKPSKNYTEMRWWKDFHKSNHQMELALGV